MKTAIILFGFLALCIGAVWLRVKHVEREMDAIFGKRDHVD